MIFEGVSFSQDTVFLKNRFELERLIAYRFYMKNEEINKSIRRLRIRLSAIFITLLLLDDYIIEKLKILLKVEFFSIVKCWLRKRLFVRKL